MGRQRKILLDSNSYFRLAWSIHPLLSVEFGEDRNCLYVCHEMEHEYKRSNRLKNRFHWVMEAEFIENRKRKISISRAEREEIPSTVEFLLAFVLDMKFPPEETIPSEVDLRVLAIGAVLQIPVVTDDRAMHRVAQQFGVEVLSSLELLKVMLDCEHITWEKIIEIAGYWIYEKDVPARFKEEWSKLFQLPPPYQ